MLALLAQVEEAADARREDVPLLHGGRRLVGGAWSEALPSAALAAWEALDIGGLGGG